MGIRFRKSVKIAPGVKINFNKKSISTTIGGKGVHHTVSSTGKKTSSVGIPGTGLYYTKTSGGSKKPNSNVTGDTNSYTSVPPEDNNNGQKWYKKTSWIIALLILFFPAGLFLMWKYSNWKKPIKIIVSALYVIGFLSVILSPSLESVEISADVETVYDVNEPVTITAETVPDTYLLSSSSIKVDDGDVDVKDNVITFTADDEGTYKIFVENGSVKSNTIEIHIKDYEKEKKEKAAEAEAKEQEERARKEAEAAAAEEAEKLKEVTEEAVEQPQPTEQPEDPIVYITNTGEKYHRSGCRFLDESKIEIPLSEAAAIYSPCGVCNPPTP